MAHAATSMEPVLSTPRYESRPLDVRIGDYTHGVFDTFQQEFVLREHHVEAQAVRAAGRYSREYENWIAK